MTERQKPRNRNIDPYLCSAIILAALVLPGSSEPLQALSLSMAMALMCIRVSLNSPRGLPGFVASPALLVPVLLFLLCLLSVSVPYLASQFQSIGSLSGPLIDPSSFFVEILKFFALGSAFLVGWCLGMRPETSRRLLDGILVAGALSACAAFVLFAFGIRKAGDSMWDFEGGRLVGALTSPNSAATLYGSMSILALSRILETYNNSRRSRPLDRISPYYLICFLINLTALCLTLSRAGIGATLICLGLVFVASVKVKKLSLPGIGAMVAGLASLAIILSNQLPLLQNRVSQSGAATLVRSDIFEAHFRAAMQRPLFGYGLGSFVTVNNAILDPSQYKDLWSIHAAHNVLIQWFEECGVVGLSAIFLLYISITTGIVSNLKSPSQTRAQSVAILGVSILFVLHGMFDYGYQEMALSLTLSVLLGLAYAPYRLKSATQVAP